MVVVDATADAIAIVEVADVEMDVAEDVATTNVRAVSTLTTIVRNVRAMTIARAVQRVRVATSVRAAMNRAAKRARDATNVRAVTNLAAKRVRIAMNVRAVKKTRAGMSVRAETNRVVKKIRAVTNVRAVMKARGGTRVPDATSARDARSTAVAATNAEVAMKTVGAEIDKAAIPVRDAMNSPAVMMAEAGATSARGVKNVPVARTRRVAPSGPAAKNRDAKTVPNRPPSPPVVDSVSASSRNPKRPRLRVARNPNPHPLRARLPLRHRLRNPNLSRKAAASAPACSDLDRLSRRPTLNA